MLTRIIDQETDIEFLMRLGLSDAQARKRIWAAQSQVMSAETLQAMRELKIYSELVWININSVLQFCGR